MRSLSCKTIFLFEALKQCQYNVNSKEIRHLSIVYRTQTLDDKK